MYQSIGDVFLQTVGKVKVEPSQQSVEEKHPINVPHPIITSGKKRLRRMEVRGYVFNDQKKTRKEYITDIDALFERATAYNRIRMEDANGYIQVNGCDIYNAEDEVNTYSILGKYLSTSEYISYYMYKNNQMRYQFNKQFPSFYVLPFGVRWNEIADEYGEHWTQSNIGQIVTPECSLPIFNLNDYLNHVKGSYSCALITEEGSVGLQALEYNISGDYAQWHVNSGLDVSTGDNTITLDCKIRNSSLQTVNVTVTSDDGIVAYTNDFDVESTEWTTITTGLVTFMNNNTGYWIRVSASPTAGSFILGGLRVNPVNRQTLLKFNTDAPNYNKGECKVYDTVAPAEYDKTKWKRVYGSHTFTGDVVFENATMQWRIRPEADWLNTGDFTDRISGEIGSILPDDFLFSKVFMNIERIRPDEITMNFTLTKSDGLVKVTAVILPLCIYFAVKPQIATANSRGWTVDLPLYTTKGLLDPFTNSQVMFTDTSSISVIKSKATTPTYSTDGICTNDGASKEGYYSFVVHTLPRVTDNTGATIHNKSYDGDDYFVDGEYVDSGKTIYLTDFINSLYECGPLTEMHLVHRFYGDRAW